jgi:hypothetical protein
VRPLRNVFYKLSCTEQRREGVAAYLWLVALRGMQHSRNLGTSTSVTFFPNSALIFRTVGPYGALKLADTRQW